MIEAASEELLDFSLAATFPASDPLSITQPGGGPQARDGASARSAGAVELDAGSPSQAPRVARRSGPA